jgi:transposase
VRELQNTLERAVALAQGGLVLAEHVRFPALGERQLIDVAQRVRERTPLARLLDETARAALAEALRQANGDRLEAARSLAVEPEAFRQRAVSLGVRAPAPEPAVELPVDDDGDGGRDDGRTGRNGGVEPLQPPFVTLSAAEREQLDDCIRRETRARHARRYRAIVVLAEGRSPAAVASLLGCSVSSVYNWASAWRRVGMAGLEESPHGGRPRALGETAERLLERLLADQPRRHGVAAPDWTVPLLRDAMERAGHPTSERTIRRLMRRLGFGWQRSEPCAGPIALASDGLRGRWARA